MWEIKITSTLTHGSHHVLLPHYEISQVSSCKTSITLRFISIKCAFLADCVAKLAIYIISAKKIVCMLAENLKAVYGIAGSRRNPNS